MVTPPKTLPNIIPTRGTITTTLNFTLWINHTNNHVPTIAVANANMARPHRVDPGINNNASKIPNWADEMVAPVVGETNLFMQSCCIIKPATLIPTPVHKIANSLGNLETIKISHCFASPENREDKLMSITPTKRERTAKRNKVMDRIMVKSLPFMITPKIVSVC